MPGAATACAIPAGLEDHHGNPLRAALRSAADRIWDTFEAEIHGADAVIVQGHIHDISGRGNRLITKSNRIRMNTDPLSL